KRVESSTALSPFAVSLPNHRQSLFPFVLSLSKQERTLRLSSPYPSTGFLRQAQDRQGERTGKALFDVLPLISSGRSRANGLKKRHPETQKD
ncbi:MAG: hypothetical protein LBD67_00180, partial [Candidatus Accumulibacter sp.]|nr:hypothetical protein [Accumulibacter sp.]